MRVDERMALSSLLFLQQDGHVKLLEGFHPAWHIQINKRHPKYKFTSPEGAWSPWTGLYVKPFLHLE